jgi:putative ABC transport system ATP-binding protein
MILGNSGSGKTSLLNIIGTIDKQTKGDLQIAGVKVTPHSSDTHLEGIRLNHIGFVFQTFNLIESMSALENVMLPMTLKGQLSKDLVRNRAEKLLEQVGLKERMTHVPSQMSGG